MLPFMGEPHNTEFSDRARKSFFSEETSPGYVSGETGPVLIEPRTGHARQLRMPFGRDWS